MEILQQTKKNKRQRNNNVDLWKKFDIEVLNKNEQPLECLYLSNKNREFCETCASSLSITEQGFLECTNRQCSILYTDVLDTGAEWRYYGADDANVSDPTRCGMPINDLLRESSYGCKVLCSSGTSYEMRKIKRYTDWQSMPYKEKSQYDEFQRISLMAQNSGISKMIVDTAIRYHKNISEQKTFRGLNRDGIIAASIYISCRINGNPRTAREIATIFHLDNTSATKGCKNATVILNTIEEDFENKDKTNLCDTNPTSFIERYCSRLAMSHDMTKLCSFIAKRIENNNYIPENTPNAIAVGIIYFIVQYCDLDISKKSISVIAEISEVTINKCYKKIEKLENELIPTPIRKKYAK